MSHEFSVIIADDPEHEKVFAEVHFDKKFVALVSQERGVDNLYVELPGLGLDERYVIRTVPLRGFVAAIDDAARRLVGNVRVT